MVERVVAADRRRFLAAVAPLAEPRSRLAYLLLAAMILLACGAAAVGGFTLSARFPLLAILALFAFAVFEAMMLRRAGWRRSADAIETIMVTATMGFATSLALVPLTAFSAPFADPTLASWDRALGFDWPAFARWVAARPAVFDVLGWAYRSFFWQGPAVLALLCVVRRQERAWQLGAASGITL